MNRHSQRVGWAIWTVAILASVKCDYEARAAESGLMYSLIAPAHAEAGSVVSIQAAVLNPSGHDADIVWPRALLGTLAVEGIQWPVALEMAEDLPVSRNVGRNGFDLRTYRLRFPTIPAQGMAVLEIAMADFGPARTVITLSGDATRPPEAVVATQRPATSLANAQPAATGLRRMFADHVAPHEPVYFIYGPRAPAIKFQLSFKYKLLDFQNLGPQTMARTVQLAFTQRSLWDFHAESSPFYDTSYMPELLYEALTPQRDLFGRAKWLGLQAALKHESNGRSGPLSRSLNIVYVRPVFALGELDDWHLLLIPELWTYLDTLEDNPRLKDYRGYGRLSVVFGRNDRPSLLAQVWGGRHFDHGSLQLDLTLPVRTTLLDFETYLLIQYFNGYGESLLGYDQHSENLRVGLSLVR